MFAGKAQKTVLSGLIFEQFKGRNVRVRGWIQRRAGPFMQLHRVAQISLAPGKNIAGNLSKAQTRHRIPAYQPKQTRPTCAMSAKIDWQVFRQSLVKTGLSV